MVVSSLSSSIAFLPKHRKDFSLAFLSRFVYVSQLPSVSGSLEPGDFPALTRLSYY